MQHLHPTTVLHILATAGAFLAVVLAFLAVVLAMVI
jgi:hypothetical protein